MLYSSVWAGLPGQTQAIETFEAAFSWGPHGQLVIAPAFINAAALDPGNSPTTELRPGLLMGQRTDGSWVNYAPGNTDGSEVAAGVLITAIRMTDIISTLTQARFYGMMIGGPIQASKILGLDQMSRQQLDKFQFDDGPFNPGGSHWFPWRRFQTKTANYSVVAADNFTVFDNTGAAGAVTYTLPPIANGYAFAFRGVVAQTFAVTSFEGANIIALNNASANTLTFSTGGQQIGGMVIVFSNPQGTKWIAENVSAGAATITVS